MLRTETRRKRLTRHGPVRQRAIWGHADSGSSDSSEVVRIYGMPKIAEFPEVPDLPYIAGFPDVPELPYVAEYPSIDELGPPTVSIRQIQQPEAFDRTFEPPKIAAYPDISSASENEPTSASRALKKELETDPRRTTFRIIGLSAAALLAIGILLNVTSTRQNSNPKKLATFVASEHVPHRIARAHSQTLIGARKRPISFLAKHVQHGIPTREAQSDLRSTGTSKFTPITELSDENKVEISSKDLPSQDAISATSEDHPIITPLDQYEQRDHPAVTQPEKAASPSTTISPEQQQQQQQQQQIASPQIDVPNPLPTSGSIIDSPHLSANAESLAKQLGLLDKLQRIQQLAGHVDKYDRLGRMNALELRRDISEVLRQTEMDVNFVWAEIMDEQGVYNELLGAFGSERDQAVAKTNLASFATNGALWAAAEAFSIPCARQAHFASPAGIIGIVAGIVPSIASAYALKQVNGRHHDSGYAPNMLAKLFDKQHTSTVEYPASVWAFLNSNPAGSSETRRSHLMKYWSNDLKGHDTEEILSGTIARKKALTGSVLSTRISMLSRLSAEIFKMNRLLDELEMALRGKKSVS